jgi:hypothetical protein
MRIHTFLQETKSKVLFIDVRFYKNETNSNHKYFYMKEKGIPRTVIPETKTFQYVLSFKWVTTIKPSLRYKSLKCDHFHHDA